MKLAFCFYQPGKLLILDPLENPLNILGIFIQMNYGKRVIIRPSAFSNTWVLIILDFDLYLYLCDCGVCCQFFGFFCASLHRGNAINVLEDSVICNIYRMIFYDVLTAFPSISSLIGCERGQTMLRCTRNLLLPLLITKSAYSPVLNSLNTISFSCCKTVYARRKLTVHCPQGVSLLQEMRWTC